MELKDQVCSLESAKRLKNLGVKQNSIFYWDEGDGIEDRLEYSPNQPMLELYSAFTVAELGILLDGWGTTKVCGWDCGVVDLWEACTNADPNKFFHETTEAEARAKMLIYLLEIKLI